MTSGYARPVGDEGPTLHNPRCEKCGKLLARRVTRPWLIECVRCGWPNGRPRPRDEDGAGRSRG